MSAAQRFATAAARADEWAHKHDGDWAATQAQHTHADERREAWNERAAQAAAELDRTVGAGNWTWNARTQTVTFSN